MKPFRQIAGFLFLVAFILLSNLQSKGQVVVDKKNLNADHDLEYIQLMYHIDKSDFKPVFYVDYGFIEPEYTDILEPERDYKQKITINGEPVGDQVTIVWFLNRMHKAGWEYMGDVIYKPLKMMDNWHVFTLRRKVDLSETTAEIVGNQ